jgi:uncharacterized peroxidase-related enzyme
VAADWRSAPLAPADRALAEYAARLTHEPAACTAADLDALRRHGFSDRALHDAVQVISYFNYVNRVADALGVETEDLVAEWEKAEDPD